MYKPLFRLRNGDAVYACKCGCEFAVLVTTRMEYENAKRGYYVASHAPLGCAPECKGRRYDFDASRNSSPVDATSGVPATPATPVIEKFNSGAPRPLSGDISDWDADAATPVEFTLCEDDEEPTY